MNDANEPNPNQPKPPHIEPKRISLSDTGVPSLVAARLLADIDQYAIDAYNDGNRWHLGASLIGDECSRKIWYGFRWVQRPVFTGRMLRLFNRGHREEDRFIEFLKGIGAEVWTHEVMPTYAPDGTIVDKGKQFRVSGLVSGHFGGSLDAIIRLPPTYGIPAPILGEFKTQGTGAGFQKLKQTKMPVAKPHHWAQTCVYGNAYNLDHVAYFAVNKNDDDLHIEVDAIDRKYAAQLTVKAERIIFSPLPLERIANSPTFQTCSYCDYKQVCHFNKPFEKNCRNCRHVAIAEGGEFACTLANAVIPRDVVATGCDSYVPIENV